MDDELFRLRCKDILGLIERRKLKRYWVAEMAGVHKTTLRRWLSGKITVVRGDHVRRLATTLEANTREIADPLNASLV